ncbi:MAG: prephenate dehydratase domain-containing protein [Succinivibrio sp.]
MRDLLQCRDDIDRIDNSILKLLAERMDVAGDIARYKLAHNQSISDPVREHSKIQTLREKSKKLGLPSSYITDLFKTIIKNTCAVEQHLIVAEANNRTVIRDTSVAYLGTKGSYSHVATCKYLEGFKGNVDATGCSSFAEIVSLVETGKCEFGVLPVENSSSGSINDVLDAIQNTKASIVGELFVPIDHCVMGVANIDVAEITDVYSHPQPITQCSNWLRQQLPNAAIHYTKASSEAMELVKSMNDPKHVALGSHMATSFYGLIPLVDNIANNPHNFTRFIVISMTPLVVPETIPAKTSLSFSVQKYQPGSLIKVLNEFSQKNLNITKLISRPRIDENRDTWEEIFFADVEANINSPAMQDILENIRPFTTALKVLGCYASDVSGKKQ